MIYYFIVFIKLKHQIKPVALQRAYILYGILYGFLLFFNHLSPPLFTLSRYSSFWFCSHLFFSFFLSLFLLFFLSFILLLLIFILFIFLSPPPSFVLLRFFYLISLLFWSSSFFFFFCLFLLLLFFVTYFLSSVLSSFSSNSYCFSSTDDSSYFSYSFLYSFQFLCHFFRSSAKLFFKNTTYWCSGGSSEIFYMCQTYKYVSFYEDNMVQNPKHLSIYLYI